MKKVISYILLIALTYNCTMNNNDYKDYNELHKHEGSENYEVTVIVPEQNEAGYIHFDTIGHHIVVDSYYESITGKNSVFKSLKVNTNGKIIDNYEIDGILKDGTMKAYDYYSNWIINGDKTKHDFINPLTSEEQKNAESWLQKFKELYNSASYIYESSWNYYFKIDGSWYEIKYNLDVVNDDFVAQHPPRQNQNVRMVQFRDLCPDFFKSRDKRDTSFVDIVGYEETDSEKGSGLNPISYSAGNYYLNLYMSLGDTIKIKRHGSMGVNMQFYKIPVTQGGRNDVVFIVQEPNEMYPDRELGGMYVVRPRNLDQKQYGPHESCADSFASQYNSIKGGTDPELKFLKPMKD
ncbi:hypothetical protein [uncultured Zobellia sp.]|uniref:hypothetical protein n=1 Tax=uncultured Zobellia sp. TaxID=255433 RepID=UPI002592BB7B|nr:hypothetical protein [uncultured Zobellia sp.]